MQLYVFILAITSVEMARSVYLRSTLARTVYNRLLQDEEERNDDHSWWYSVNLDVFPTDFQSQFLQCYEDTDTTAFLNNCHAKADKLFTQLFHSLAKTFLMMFMTTTSANGWLGRGSMFVLSKQQFQNLMGIDDNWKAMRLLDLGAGDGAVTKQISTFFDEVHTTEVSKTMRWRLQQQGFKVLDLTEWSNGSYRFDVISCLNLLDRCDKPISILRDMRENLVPETGRVLLATVFPFKPYVEETADNLPSERIHVDGNTFEEQLFHFITDVLQPAGYSVVRFSRVPYLCEGDLEKSFYSLSDAVFVLRTS